MGFGLGVYVIVANESNLHVEDFLINAPDYKFSWIRVKISLVFYNYSLLVQRGF